MKQTDKKKPVNAIPQGVWEGTHTSNNHNEKCTLTTDLQGNGYPIISEDKKANSNPQK